MPRRAKRSAHLNVQRKRLSRSAAAVKKQQQRYQNYWAGNMHHFDIFLKHIRGIKDSTRSSDENRLILCAIRAALKRQLNATHFSSNFFNTVCINWTAIENEIARDFFLPNGSCKNDP